VVRVTRVEANDYFVVLGDGVQRIGEVAALLIRVLGSQGTGDITSVSPEVLGEVPVVDSLPVSTYPRRVSATLGAADNAQLCAQWLPDGPKTVLSIGDSLPVTSTTLQLAQGDGAGPEIDSVVVPPGRSAYVRAAALSGGIGESGPLYLMTDSGVLFGIRDGNTAKQLGVDGEPVAAPWPVLCRDGALVARDSVALPP
jgi:type VII secretion protein EccB